MGINLNLSGTLSISKLLVRPQLCLPHATVSTFADLPIPLNKLFGAKPPDIRAVVLDKDDCFAWPEEHSVWESNKITFSALRAAYPGPRLLIVSNTAGAQSYDPKRKLAAAVEEATGVKVLQHRTKKPGCGEEIMKFFREHPEAGVTRPSQVAVVGDRLATDMMLANGMGSWGVWVREGVVPVERKSLFARWERRVEPWLVSRGYEAPRPESPFE